MSLSHPDPVGQSQASSAPPRRCFGAAQQPGRACYTCRPSAEVTPGALVTHHGRPHRGHVAKSRAHGPRAPTSPPTQTHRFPALSTAQNRHHSPSHHLTAAEVPVEPSFSTGHPAQPTAVRAGRTRVLLPGSSGSGVWGESPARNRRFRNAHAREGQSGCAARTHPKKLQARKRATDKDASRNELRGHTISFCCLLSCYQCICSV